jgi:serine/threonine protein phosphatase PrpC
VFVTHTRSLKGWRTADNRDVAGNVEQAGDHLFVMIDGSHSEGSGDLARALKDFLIEAFQSRQPTSRPGDPQEVLHDLVHEAHREVSPQFPMASASYLILRLTANGEAHFQYEGDCCLGSVMGDGAVTWLTSPHCMANWRGNKSIPEITDSITRHRVTRSFRARRNPNPAIGSFRMDSSSRLLLCTDGFWADQPASAQLEAIMMGNLSTRHGDDDVTWMLISQRD